MLSKSRIQFINSLAINKYRKINRKFIAEGPKIVGELLLSGFVCEGIYALGGWIENNLTRLPKEIEIIEITEKELKRISSLKTPNQVVAVVNMPLEAPTEIPVPQENIVLLLDGISDPGNMGTIIRTADWFGIQNILCSENCVDVYNPKVVQATMGSIFRVNVNYVSPEKYLERLPKNIPVYATMLDGKNLYEAVQDKKCVLLIGNESHGISEYILPYVTKKIRIPDYSFAKSFTAESLNASVAAAIVIAEFRRKWSAEK
jgi:RNA methyltransferase, TrmH family